MPSVDILVAGTSCKNFSSLCAKEKRASPATFKRPDVGDSSSNTAMAALAYMRAHLPAICIFENVPGIGSSIAAEVTALDLLFAEMRGMGYITESHIINSSSAGPQSRPRLWYWAVRGDRTHLSADLNMKIQSGIDLLLQKVAILAEGRREHGCLDSYLEPNRNCGDVGPPPKRARAQAAQASSEARVPLWLAGHRAYESLLLQRCLPREDTRELWGCLRSSSALSTLTDRQWDMVRIKLLEHGRQLQQGILDASQSVERVHVAFNGNLPCITPSAQMLHFGQGRVLSGYELFKVCVSVADRRRHV